MLVLGASQRFLVLYKWVSNSTLLTEDIRDVGLIPGSERSPGGGVATHPSIFASRIP